jgi:hypothetical protein
LQYGKPRTGKSRQSEVEQARPASNPRSNSGKCSRRNTRSSKLFHPAGVSILMHTCGHDVPVLTRPCMPSACQCCPQTLQRNKEIPAYGSSQIGCGLESTSVTSLHGNLDGDPSTTRGLLPHRHLGCDFDDGMCVVCSARPLAQSAHPRSRERHGSEGEDDDLDRAGRIQEIQSRDRADLRLVQDDALRPSAALSKSGTPRSSCSELSFEVLPETLDSLNLAIRDHGVIEMRWPV